MRPAEAPPRAAAAAAVPLRPPAQVMRLARLGCFFPTRLSFMPTLLRRLGAGGSGARVARPLWEMDAAGHGRAVYTLELGGRSYSLVAVSQDLAPEARSDRVIAEAWDATFALYDGRPDAAELARLAASLPRQEAGRFTPRELVLSRANKSVRMFAHVVERLAAGRQPDAAMLAGVGYLMRTTAVYGNGKFGIADRECLAARPEFRGAFQPEMLAVYLIRGFTQDLAEHVAAARAPATAVRLAPAVRRYLGVGNSTGLGMAPFLISHPVLIHNWMTARETALARVRGLPDAGPAEAAHFRRLLGRAAAHVDEWLVEDARQTDSNRRLRADIDRLAAATGDAAQLWTAARPWDRLFRWAEAELGLEAQELLVALLLEPHGPLVDALAEGMTAPEGGQLDPAMSLAGLRRLIARQYDWALRLDFDAPGAQQHFWYVSEEKLEPRLGERASEPGADREMPLAIARDVQRLAALLDGLPGRDCVARLLLRHPELRHLVRRIQVVAAHPYGEVRDNLVGADCHPIDLLRCKLSFFGAAKFDPKSDRWTRIAMYQGAPLPEELGAPGADDWCLPVLRRDSPGAVL